MLQPFKASIVTSSAYSALCHQTFDRPYMSLERHTPYIIARHDDESDEDEEAVDETTTQAANTKGATGAAASHTAQEVVDTVVGSVKGATDAAQIAAASAKSAGHHATYVGQFVPTTINRTIAQAKNLHEDPINTVKNNPFIMGKRTRTRDTAARKVAAKKAAAEPATKRASGPSVADIDAGASGGETLKDPSSKEGLANIVRTAIGHEDLIGELVAEAALTVMPKNPGNFDVDSVQIVKILGGSIHDTKVV
ncbi:T-complex protein 1 subunit theta [Thoreauomyces humboldtii]|nr:T-complex protein 1 subunit theta [Thoreauomyces humboldtii]